MDDYPDAHSMDSTWFAVDRDGHVGHFDTGEAGAMPAEIAENEQDVLGRLATVLPRSPVLLDLKGMTWPGASEQGNHYTYTYGATCLFFLASVKLLQAEIDAGRARIVPSSSHFAVIWNRISNLAYRKLHNGGRCLGCFTWMDIDDDGSTAAQLGFYSYDHLGGNRSSNPYGRKKLPANPIHVDQLPPDVRRHIGQLRFENLSFAQTPHIQPVEHFDCASWQARYWTVDGKEERPIPGREDEFEEEDLDGQGEPS